MPDGKGWSMVTEVRRNLFGYEISARALTLDEGISVLICGGCKSHIGAVSIAGPEGIISSVELPGHREGEVSEKWAAVISKATGEQCCVQAGIHYDNATCSQINEIQAVLEQMLGEFISKIVKNLASIDLEQ